VKWKWDSGTDPKLGSDWKVPRKESIGAMGKNLKKIKGEGGLLQRLTEF